MPAPRRYDPLNLPEQIMLVTDPVREAEIVAEVSRKIRYLIRSYRLERRLGLDTASFNASLEGLREAPDAADASGMTKLNPWIEMAVNFKARELAGIAPEEPLRKEHGVFVRQAVQIVAARATAVRGTPGYRSMRRYVEALMVIIQEATGKPVLSARYKQTHYDPQMLGSMGALITTFVQDLEPDVRVSRIATWVREARKKYAGHWPSFEDLFPGYAGGIE